MALYPAERDPTWQVSGKMDKSMLSKSFHLSKRLNK